MSSAIHLDKSQLSSATRLFSSAVLHELVQTGHSALFARLAKQAGLDARLGHAHTVGGAFDEAFKLLTKPGNRSDYIYRSAICHNILLGKHSLRTTTWVPEFRAGRSKADVVLLNGTSTVYEIKSDRDSLDRLAGQIRDYKKVFAAVNVIAAEKHIDGIRGIVSEDVGILSLTKRNRISTIRNATSLPERIQPAIVFESLQAGEAIAVLRALGEDVPNVPNIYRHRVLKELFSELEPAALHRELLKVLKQSRRCGLAQDVVADVPKSLKAAMLSNRNTRLRGAAARRLLDTINSPFRTALTWG